MKEVDLVESDVIGTSIGLYYPREFSISDEVVREFWLQIPCPNPWL